jgi:cell division septation protein DedD
MSNIRAKNNLAAEVKQLIAGANKHFSNGSQALQVGGATFTVTALTQELQGFVDNRDAVEASKAATKAKIEIERVQSPSQLALIRAFVTVIRGTFGNSADVLADFGLAPPKARVTRTAEEKAVSAAKSAATRAARGTMGKNQKKAVKGSITAKLVVTPVTTSPVSTPVAAPAPAAPAPAPATPATTTAAPTGTTPAVATVAATAPHTA